MKINNIKNQLQQLSTVLSYMLGASMLSCSYIFYKIGIVQATVIIILTVVCDFIVYHYFIKAYLQTGAKNYKELVQKLLGRGFSVVLEISNVILIMGALIAYIIIISDGIHTFILNQFAYNINTQIIKTIIAILIIFPLCLLNKVKQLEKIGSIAIFLILINVSTVIYYFASHSTSKQLCTDTSTSKTIKFHAIIFPETIPKWRQALNFLMYVPSLQTNFIVHSFIPSLQQESMKSLGDKAKQQVQISVFFGLVIVAIFNILVGVLGQIMFGHDIKPNLLQSFAPCRFRWIDACVLLYSIVLIFIYPLILFPVKTSLASVINIQKPDVFVAFSAVSLSLICALFVESIVVIFGITAAFIGIVFFYACPILIIINAPLLKMYKKHKERNQILIVHEESDKLNSQDVAENLSRQNIKIKKGRKIVGYIILMIFSAICLIGVVMNVYEVVAE